MDEAQRPASMADVARVAGVSAQTVSRVANGIALVAPATRARVERAMAEVGYRPNTAARALKSGRFHTLGVVTYTLETVGSVRLLDAIVAEAARRGYSVELIALSDPSGGEVSRALDRLRQQAVDGVVVRIDAHRAPEGIAFPDGLPVVLVDPAEDAARTTVDADQEQGMRLAVEHLLGLGHPTVHHLAGPVGAASAEARERGWRGALAAAGRPAPEPLRADWTAAAGYAAGRRFAADPAVSAIACANDQQALGVLRALHEAGRDVPGEVSVTGFDDVPEAAQYWPPLTTVHQDFHAVGALATALLVERIEGGGTAGPHRLENTLVIRESTGSCQAR